MTSTLRSTLVVLGFTLLIVTIASSCWVHRKSSDYECTTDDDCASDRVCNLEIGYCLLCPPECDSCDPRTRQCMMTCTSGGNACKNFRCPAGFDCTIRCMTSGACENIDCSDARSCTVTCSTGNACNIIDCGSDDTACNVTCSASSACDDVRCGGGPCRVTCTGAEACEDVGCASSCKCDVDCASSNCNSATCPPGCSTATGCSSLTTGCAPTC